MSLVQLFEWVDDGGDLLTVLIGHIEKVDDFTDGGILEDEHMLRQNFNEGHEAPLGVVPGVRVDLHNRRCTFFWMGSRDLMILLIPNSKLSLEQYSVPMTRLTMQRW